MTNSFKFAATPTIQFGVQKIKMLPQLIQQFGNKALIVTGKSSFLKTFIAIELFHDLEVHHIETKIVHVEGEPTPHEVDEAVNTYRKWKPGVVVAVGGGSVMDAGKAISAMLCEKGSVSNFLEEIGTRLPSGHKIPFIAVPTTAGTGSEATKNAVITQPGWNGFKKSLRHDLYVPNIALIDPQLTSGCPPLITASSGMDAFTQLLEAYLSTNSNALSDALALEGLAKLLGSIEKAVMNGSDLKARTDMSYAALLSGMALANAGLGVVHGFAQPLGSLFKVPHGRSCGTLMGAANRISVQHLRERRQSLVLDKYFNVARLISTSNQADRAIDEFLDHIDRLTELFKLPRLTDFGISIDDFPAIVAQTGLKYHPVELNDEDLFWILKQRL